MRIQTDPRLPASNDKTGPLTARLYELWRNLATSINGSAMWNGEGTSAPTTGTWAQGDVYRNTAPVEAGSASSKYVTLGWICTVSGTPGTWLPMRVLTGN
jgi:hypothetical protein